MEKMNYPTTPEGKKQMEKDGEKIMTDEQKKVSEERADFFEAGKSGEGEILKKLKNDYTEKVETFGAGKTEKAKEFYEEIKEKYGYSSIFSSDIEDWNDANENTTILLDSDDKMLNDKKKVLLERLKNGHKDKVVVVCKDFLNKSQAENAEHLEKEWQSDGINCQFIDRINQDLLGPGVIKISGFWKDEDSINFMAKEIGFSLYGKDWKYDRHFSSIHDLIREGEEILKNKEVIIEVATRDEESTIKILTPSGSFEKERE